jgi:hypothetical protein
MMAGEWSALEYAAKRLELMIPEFMVDVLLSEFPKIVLP